MSDYEGENDDVAFEDPEVDISSDDSESDKSDEEGVDALSAALAEDSEEAKLASAQQTAAVRSSRVAVRRPKPDPIVKYMNTNCNVVLIKGDARIMQNVVTKQEAINIIATRATQIASHPTVFRKKGDPVPTGPGSDDPAEKAKKELMDRCCPLLIRRFKGFNEKGDKVEEEWNPNEMALPNLD